MTETSQKTMIKVTDITELLDCTPGFVYSAVKKGELKCFRIGKNMRFEKKAVNKWINNDLRSKEGD